MDTEHTNPEKHIGDGHSEREGAVLQIKEFDLVRDIESFLPVLWQAWYWVHGEDKATYTDIEILGKKHSVPEVEALLYWYLHDQGSKIRVTVLDGEIAAFVIYNQVFDGVFSIRLLFVSPKTRRAHVGRDLMASIPGVKCVLFQTKKEMPPDSLYRAIGVRPIGLFEDEKTVTYAMQWGD